MSRRDTIGSAPRRHLWVGSSALLTKWIEADGIAFCRNNPRVVFENLSPNGNLTARLWANVHCLLWDAQFQHVWNLPFLSFLIIAILGFCQLVKTLDGGGPFLFCLFSEQRFFVIEGVGDVERFLNWMSGPAHCTCHTCLFLPCCNVRSWITLHNKLYIAYRWHRTGKVHWYRMPVVALFHVLHWLACIAWYSIYYDIN